MALRRKLAEMVPEARIGMSPLREGFAATNNRERRKVTDAWGKNTVIIVYPHKTVE